MISDADVERVARAAGGLPPAQSVYIEEDFVMNLLETVLDYMLQTPVVVKALEHFRDNRWDEVRTLDDLAAVVGRYPDDEDGNKELARYLWGYNLWTRAHQLRGLATFFRGIGVVDQDGLRSWAHASEFRRDFEGRVKGLGPAVYQWLVMRQGVDTVKPDVHVRRFTEAALGRPLSDRDVIDVMCRAAQALEIKAYELDWRVWEASRGGGLPTAPKPLVSTVPVERASAPVSALLVIDAQMGLLDGPTAVPSAAETSARIAEVLAAARSAGALVIHLQNDGAPGARDEPGSLGWAIHPAAEPSPEEQVLRKSGDNGFDGTRLEMLLRDAGVRRLAVAGLLSEMCVSATIRGAFARGFQVVLVRGGHATYDVDDIAADVVSRVAEHSLGDELELLDSGSVSFVTPSQRE